MSDIWQQNLLLLLPELFLLLGICAVLLQGAFSSGTQSYTSYLLSLSIAAIFLLLTCGGGLSTGGYYITAFNGTHAIDLYAVTLKMLIAGATMLSFYYGRHWMACHPVNAREHYLFGLFALLGASIMVSATNFLSLYVGLELMSLALYSMIAIYPEAGRRTEAAMKYFVLGALASGILLYGISCCMERQVLWITPV